MINDLPKSVYAYDYKNHKVLYNLQNGEIALIKSADSVKDSKDLSEVGFFADDDRIDRFREEFPQKVRPEQLYMIVTEGCNLRCKYCRQSASNDYPHMSLDDVENAIDSFFKLSDTLKSVVFYGGEPLMNKEAVFHTIEYIKEKYPEASPNYSMITNAILADEETAKRLYENNVNIIVSVDGPKEFHDKARADVDGKSHYEETMAGYRNLKAAGCIVGTNTVIGPHNENEFERLVAWIKEISPNSVGFALPHGNEKNYAMDVRFAKIYENVINAFEELFKIGISVIQVERKFKDIILNNLNSFECRACRNRIVACADRFFGVCEGAVTNKDMFTKDISKLQEYATRYQYTSPLMINDCSNCKSIRFCGGGCPYDKLMRYQRVDCPDRYRCGLMNKITDVSLGHIADYILEHDDSDNNIVMFNDDMRSGMFDRINFSGKVKIPLTYNCDARTEK